MAEPAEQKNHSNVYILSFVIILCFVAGTSLAIVSFSLSKTQEEAKAFDANKQMLTAAKILTPGGTFQLLKEDGTWTPAAFDSKTKVLVPDISALKASEEEITLISALRIHPLLTDAKGEVYTFDSLKIEYENYLASNKKSGYAELAYKLFYAITPNATASAAITSADIAKDHSKAEIFVIPISGFGLWGPIYGYLALGSNGDNVIGTTWYEHGETPGLGANIAEPAWQSQFYGKVIFQESASGKVDPQIDPIGITVVKGKVSTVYGASPKALSAVDGISGATLTGDGVTKAYHDSLSPYRTLLSNLYETLEKNGGQTKTP